MIVRPSRWFVCLFQTISERENATQEGGKQNFSEGSQRNGFLSRIYGKDGYDQPDLWGGSPKGLYIRQPRASAASPWEKTSILRTLKGFNIEWFKRGKV
jgi:hypothetical protein